MRIIKKFIRWVLLLFFGSSLLAVVALKYVPVYITPLMVIRCYQQVKNGQTLKLKHKWVPIEEISPDLLLAIWISEDAKFITHNGFDFKSINSALKNNSKGKKLRGASTITQQTAKNVFLWPDRSWVRKGLEAYFTVLMEFILDKQRIMEIYVNSIEMGNGIYGVEAVAHEHFGCSAKDLTKQQSALIAASLPNPIKYNSAAPSRYMFNRQKKILRDMPYYGHFPSKEEIKEIRKKH